MKYFYYIYGIKCCLINFMGQRTKKSNASNKTWFIYDENDNLIAEYDANGDLVNEYICLNDTPITLIRNSNIYYIYTDHLNTPRAVTNISNNLVWTWENKEAFGNNQPDENVSGSNFKFNLRFPGQYFDIETNLNYNINRDYNPAWGRYVQSDPLGLSAGLNTYGYVGSSPLGLSDKLGLKPVEYYLEKWICSSNSWQDAFNKAYNQKFGPFDQDDLWDDDNRTAAEHYIFGRMLGAEGTIAEKRLYDIYGSYLGPLYQGVKQLGLKDKASRSSYVQLYWEQQAFLDHWKNRLNIKKENKYNPKECDCIK